MFWYVMRSKPNKEMTLSLELSARDVEVFYPQLRVQPANPRSRRVLPYFPGYMFVHVDLKQIGFSELHWLPFSLGLVSFGGEPSMISDGLVRAIRQCVDETNSADGEPLSVLKRGDAVVISSGPFSGYEAIFDLSLHGAERVRVLLKLLTKQQLPLELPAGYIQQLNRPCETWQVSRFR